MPSSVSCPRAITNFRFQCQTKTLSPPCPNLSLSFCKPSRLSSFSLTLRSQFQEQPSRTIRLLTSNRSRIHCGASSDNYSANSKKSFGEWVEWVGEGISSAFPLWFYLACLLLFFKPSSFSWITPEWSTFGLTLTMFGMGTTLTLDDFRGALAMTKELITGFVLQYTVMPLSAFLVSKFLNLPCDAAASLILFGCCPGAAASNIVTYLARGNVALSVLMTAASTLSAVIMTPFLTAKHAGKYVAVDAVGLLVSTLQVVLLPVLGGAFLKQYFNGLVKFVSPLTPTIAAGTLGIQCGNVIISSYRHLLVAKAFFRALIFSDSAFVILIYGVQVPVSALFHASGFFFGYILSRMLGLDVASSRTISIEVGMKNVVLGVVIATQYLQDPSSPVTFAVSGICQTIIGSVLAGIWRRDVPKQKSLTTVSASNSI
ncbi:probable sodium/metabolite cotransporter BASS1, chloroplastic [Hibiscus syriacus]|uniref:probable sodium/metabolite cotransporter BASS1, chloroplastic n=1 Tax=Hibiscus syriacus TaxID=106335 RepID=UPI0019235DF2|nr:probable sodium/metabolite cotransporter BASS1, chloroplastic [Hibiscus syriacus]